MITAAEKFDLVPPWCVVKKGATYNGVSRWRVESHDGSRCALGPNDDGWASGCGPYSYIDDEPAVRHIARLTRPLDSWEPAPDCALPVDGWNIRKCADGNYGVFTIPDGVFALKALTFSTRRAAYVWAWTEAEAPATAVDAALAEAVQQTMARSRCPITEADVKVGQRWQSREWEYVDTITKIDGSYVYYDQVGRDGCVRPGLKLGVTDYAEWATESATLITDGTGATDGPSDDRGELGWAAFDELCKTVDDVDTLAVEVAEALGARVSKVEGDVVSAVRAIDGDRVSNSARHEELHTYLSRNSDRISKVEGVLARIGSMESFIAEAQALANRLTIVERLVAAQVHVPATLHQPSQAANVVEKATAVEGADWRDALVAGGTASRIVYTPCGDWCCNDRMEWAQSCLPGIPVSKSPNGPNETQRAIIRSCPPPPNLAKWWKPGAKADTLESLRGDVRAAEAAWERSMDTLVMVRKAVPKVYDIPGTDVVACVRNLASAHDTALKDMAEYRTALDVANHTSDSALTDLGALRGALWLKPDADGADMVNAVTTLRSELAAAQTAATAAEGRAATARRHAADAEAKLAELRADIENVRASLGT